MQERETKILFTEVLIINYSDADITSLFAEVGYPTNSKRGSPRTSSFVYTFYISVSSAGINAVCVSLR